MFALPSRSGPSLAARFAGLAIGLGSLLGSAPALANGAFPAVSQLVADPGDPTHLVLRSNFGLLTSRDQGNTWDLVCEAGMGYQNEEPAIAVLGNGTTIAGLSTGVAHGAANECDFSLGTGVTGYVLDVTRVPGTQADAVAVSVDFDDDTSQVWHTSDGGASWRAWGVALDAFDAATIEITSDDVLYVSGLSQADTVKGVLARSSDEGKTWSRFDVPSTSSDSAPYIAAVAGDDSDTLYVRLSGSPGRLLGSHDGGQHFEDLLDFTGPFDGFALSPDGRYALASGRSDGVWRAPTSTLSFEQLSCEQLRCLSWTDAGLFACAYEFEAGFLVGQSSDLGQSFQPLLHMSCVRGPLACAADSSVGQTCGAAWPMISDQLGTDCASAATFVPRTDCLAKGGAGGLAGSTASGSAGASFGTGSTRTGSGGSESVTRPHGGGCSFARTPAGPRAWLAVLVPLAWLIRRRIGTQRPGALLE